MKFICLNALVIAKNLGQSSDTLNDHRQVNYYKKDPETFLLDGDGHLVHDCSVAIRGNSDFIPCKVIYSTGPDLLYITTNVEEEEDVRFRQMEQAMGTWYAETKEQTSPSVWEAGSVCAVRCDDTHKRGVVRGYFDEDGQHLLVRLVDEGKEVRLHISLTLLIKNRRYSKSN